MILSRRILMLTGAAALTAISNHALAQDQTAWTAPPQALAMPGYALWDQPAPEAQAPLNARVATLTGERRLRELIAGKPAILSFWAEWCPPCLAEMPSLDFLVRRLAGAGDPVRVLSIMTYAPSGVYTPEEAQERQRRLGAENIEPLADAVRTRRSPFNRYIRMSPIDANIERSSAAIPCTTLVGPDGSELGRVTGFLKAEPPAGLSAEQIRRTSVRERRNWPQRDIWMDDEMFEFLCALGA